MRSWTSDTDKQLEHPAPKSSQHTQHSVSCFCPQHLSCCIHTLVVLCCRSQKQGCVWNPSTLLRKHVSCTPAILGSLKVDMVRWVFRKKRRRRRSYSVSQRVMPVVHSTALIDSSLLCRGTDRQKEGIGSMIHDMHSMPSRCYHLWP